ncbi:MAG: methyltransferase domain-containing protein [Gammaproteobacteria bacterium]|nr:methyltransferase domain-containing protein [Gammaproteobacteria bacterium]
MKSTAYYDQNADALIDQYGALNADDVHEAWASTHLPKEPGFACDIGAGSGRDALWLADQGWEVVAVEPSALRDKAAATAHPRVTWLNDALPSLTALRALGRRFDLILLSAVWMHVAPKDRERAFRILSELLNPSGLLVITLRKGADEHENVARGFHPTSADELIGYANQRAVGFKGRAEADDLVRGHVRWEALVFEMPDDGTGSLPLLRHVIVNDNKSSTYKLGLLRVLVRIAESAPGIVITRTDDYVDIPFGVVGLYWIKQYRRLVDRGIPQLLGKKTGYGWAKGAFYQLMKEISPSDLRLGAGFDADRGEVVTRAIADACRNIKAMPAKYITYPGSPDQPVFECDLKPVRKPKRRVVLSKEYLAKFGRFRVQGPLWQTLGQYACWLDPVIVREWSQMMTGWGVADARTQGSSALDWQEGIRDTKIAIERAEALRDDGFDLTCVWSASRIRSSFQIDHCFPWARWYNNDLWNLLPTKVNINRSKLDKLPSSLAMSDARTHIIDWWSEAWEHSAQSERFFMEAGYSLPGLSGHRPSLDEIYQATLHQRARLKQDQQLVEWSAPGRG